MGLLELFGVFFKLGAFTIGGGVAMLPLLQNLLIEEKKWFTEDEFVDLVAVVQSLPGVIAINMATYVGYKKRGFLGSLVSTIGVALPSFVLILLMAHGITVLGSNRIAMGAMAGLRATAIGLITVAVIQLAPVAVKSKWGIAAAVAAFTMIVAFKINTAYVILTFLIIGVISTIMGPKLAERRQAPSDEDGGDKE